MDWNENLFQKIGFTKILDFDETMTENFNIFDKSPIDYELSSENMFYQNIGLFQ